MGGMAPSKTHMRSPTTLLAQASLPSSPTQCLPGAPYASSGRLASASSTGESSLFNTTTGCHQEAGSSHITHSASILPAQRQLSSSTAPYASGHDPACHCGRCRTVSGCASSSSSPFRDVLQSLGCSRHTMQVSATHAMHNAHSIRSKALSIPTSHSPSCKGRRSLWSAAFCHQSAAAGWPRQCTRSQPLSLHSSNSVVQQLSCTACGRRGPCMHRTGLATAAAPLDAGPGAAPADNEQAPKYGDVPLHASTKCGPVLHHTPLPVAAAPSNGCSLQP